MITKEQVRHIAELARLKLADEEVKIFQKDLGEILEYFEVLRSADVQGAEPMTHAMLLENIRREDARAKQKWEAVERLMKLLPEKEQGFAKVPKILRPATNET